MANKQHVEWLEESVDAWNTKRERTIFAPDLREAELQNANLQQANLQQANLLQANLLQADLIQANLKNANLWGAYLREAQLQQADLELANLKWANLQRADLRGADLQRANLFGADLRGADVTTLTKKAGKGVTPPIFTNLSTTHNLTSSQLTGMTGDTGTLLPIGMEHPDHWLQWDADEIVSTSTVPNEPGNADVRVRPWYAKAQQKLAPITPIADVAWTQTGELNVQTLTPIKSEPRKSLPIPQPEALDAIKRGLIALSNQLQAQLDASLSHNAATFIGDARHIFNAIETQLSLPNTEIIPVLVKANFNALERLGPSAEALADTEEAIFHVFMEEGQKLLHMIPELQIVEDPYNETLITDTQEPDALEILGDLDDLINTPEITAQIGPKLGGVTRAADGFNWINDKQKIVNKTAMWNQVVDKLENPPKAIEGSATYVTALAPVIALIWALLKLLFGTTS